MAEITHYRCDRCGFLEVDPAATGRLHVHPSENLTDNPFPHPDIGVDLCFKCEKALVKWFKTPQEPT